MQANTHFNSNQAVRQAIQPALSLTKKLFFFVAAGTLALTSCKKEEGVDPNPTTPVVQPLTLEEGIKVKTELVDRVADPELPDYIVTKHIAVNAELTIRPGVVIAFERDIRMDVNTDGLIIAQGTAGKKIRFIGVQKTKGYWVGIAHYSRSNANVFEHVEVLHAGSRPIFSTTKSALFISGSQAQIALKNTLFSQNDGYGLYVYGGGILREFARNAFTTNTEAGIMVDPENVAKLDAASTFTGGNGHNVVDVTAGGIKNSPNDVVWAGFADKTPYRISGDFAVNAAWKLSPGVTLEMNRDAVIRINSDGYISAKGTPTEKITFTGANRTAGFWKGIICYSADSKNVIENAEISNAGSNVIVSGKKANVAVYGNRATMTIKNTQISNSGGYGVFVSYGASVNTDVTTANSFAANAQTNVMIEK
ncbi:hypothetical protein GCM10023189_09970 [Nibrella saemangeumensis]|uniref:Right handed beta helix region n=1 Tax=Nibrella saemangeumensis TaxID=1084526 RepID=A0ABP8MJ35_9BACT